MLIPTDWGAGRGACTAILGCRWGRGQCLLMDMACFFFSGVMWDPTWAWDAPAKLRLRWVYRWVTLEIYRDELYLKCTWMSSYTWNVHGWAILEMYMDWQLYLKCTQMSYTWNIHRGAIPEMYTDELHCSANCARWALTETHIDSTAREGLVPGERKVWLTLKEAQWSQSYRNEITSPTF